MYFYRAHSAFTLLIVNHICSHCCPGANWQQPVWTKMPFRTPVKCLAHGHNNRLWWSWLEMQQQGRYVKWCQLVFPQPDRWRWRVMNDEQFKSAQLKSVISSLQGVNVWSMGSEEIFSLSLVSQNLLMISYHDKKEKGVEVFSALPVPFIWRWKASIAS